MLVRVDEEPYIEFTIHLLRYVFCTLIVIIGAAGYSNLYLAMLGGYLLIDNFIVGMIVTEKRYYSSNKIINILLIPTKIFQRFTMLLLRILNMAGYGVSKVVKSLLKEPS